MSKETTFTSTPPESRQPISDFLLSQFNEFVAAQMGLFFPGERRRNLEQGIYSAARELGFKDAESFIQQFMSSTLTQSQVEILASHLTTGETYFFRDKGHSFLLQNIVLPELIKNKEKQHAIRIWSAGCSTGEEAYSVAILLDMLLPDLEAWDISIIGTDINEESLQKAERGIYTQWSFRMVDKKIQRKYFNRHHKDEWEIDGRIKKMVKFRHGNLIEDDFPSQHSGICNMDIILCRNVFIYFKSEAVSPILNKFIKTLNNGGYLITGHGELFGQSLVNLSQIMFPEAVIYKKVADFRKPVPEFKKVKKDEKTKEIKIIHTPPIPGLSKSTIQNPKKQIEGLIETGRYSEAVEKAEKVLNVCSEDYDTHCLKAQAYANSGDYKKAEQSCRKAIHIHPTLADPYFLLAQIAEAGGNDEEAKDFLKNTLYLDPTFIAAYIELGGLYEKGNDLQRAKKSRSTAIELLRSLPSQEPVKPYNVTAGELIQYVENLTGSKNEDLQPVISGGKNRR
jgi:chemotaxis protein methyltransferase CheR